MSTPIKKNTIQLPAYPKYSHIVENLTKTSSDGSIAGRSLNNLPTDNENGRKTINIVDSNMTTVLFLNFENSSFSNLII